VSELRKAVVRAESYIRSRQSDNGGFCFYRADYVDEPNLHDTYYAVAALKLLGAEVARKDRLVQFVDRFPLWGLNYLYHYAFTLDLLGQARLIDKDRLARIHSLTIAAPRALRSGQTRAWLEDALMTLQLRRRFAEIAEYPEVVHLINSLNRGGGYGDKPNLWDTYLSLSILEALGKCEPEEECKLESFRRPIPAFSETLPVGRALEQVLHQREAISLVTARSGEVVGLVTLEDLLEAILGMEITDEAEAVAGLRLAVETSRKRRIDELRRRRMDGHVPPD
jgi:hypothetical protein